MFELSHLNFFHNPYILREEVVRSHKVQDLNWVVNRSI